MKIWDVQPGLHVFFQPTPKHGFDFSREDFGGFTFELIDEGVVLDRIILRFRYTNLYKYKQNINDFYHPSFVNYREFFVDDKYKDFPLNNCENVIDAGASVGLFTQYILNKGAKQVISVECDERSIKALQGNFYSNDNVTIIPKALSDDIGEQVLYWKDDNPLISTLTTNHSEFAHDNNHNSGIIIISPSIPSENVLTVLRNHINEIENPLVQIFEIRHLQFDISKHRKVPKHRIISDAEKVSILKEFNLKDSSFLPKIDSQDAMAKWIGCRPGDIVEITGLCDSTGENKRYRFCVADVTNG
jgi:FkbM family methyltransferase